MKVLLFYYCFEIILILFKFKLTFVLLITDNLNLLISIGFFILIKYLVFSGWSIKLAICFSENSNITWNVDNIATDYVLLELNDVSKHVPISLTYTDTDGSFSERNE